MSRKIDPTTIILRHRKENLKKCSLRGLENRNDLIFLTYPIQQLPDLSSYVILSVEAPSLSHKDSDKGLFLIDGTWRYAEVMHRQISQGKTFTYRSIPKGFRTAYPRKQTDCPNPEAGLASVEALYLAYFLMGKNPEGLLDHYYWKETFLKKNSKFLIK